MIESARCNVVEGMSLQEGQPSTAVNLAVLDTGTIPDITTIFDSRTAFLVGLLIAGSGIVSPPAALTGGVVFGFAVEHP